MRRPPFKAIAEQVRDRMFKDPSAPITADQLDHFIMMCSLELIVWRESDPRDQDRFESLFDVPKVPTPFDDLFEPG